MKPSQDDFLTSCARWNDGHRGIRYELSWHGRSEHAPEGTWCWYLFVSSEQFYSDDWSKLRLKHYDKQMFGNNWHRHWDYAGFPDLDAHGGWTFAEMTVYLGKDGKEYEMVKIGCDYGHLWDRETGYPHGKAQVATDAKRSIDLLCERFPRRRQRCAYSGLYDDHDKFYTTVRGELVHLSHEDELKAMKGWEGWHRAPTVEGVS